MKSLAQKKPVKNQREKLVLLKLIDLYLQSGKPIGSNTLKENGFESLSSATIRNYFAKLEETGFLKQHHASGGRVPTSLAFKLYAETYRNQPLVEESEKNHLRNTLLKESKEVASYLQKVAEQLSALTKCAVFLSSPRFDQDFILSIKLLSIDSSRCLCVLITDFGLINSEVLYTDKQLSASAIQRLESYFNWKISGLDKPYLDGAEEALASTFYKEVMLRHIVGHTHFSREDLYKTGFSKLLNYPDFNDAAALANGLSLFENELQLRSLLNESCRNNELNCWIGEDLHPFAPNATACSVISIPYRINQTIAGAIAILGPTRIPYRHLFGLLQMTSDLVSESLTRSIYKFKITFRQPQASHLELKNTFLNQTQCLLLEDKT